MAYTIATEYPHPILNTKETVNVSIYSPTHRDVNKNEEDKIRLSNLIKSTEKQLRNSFDEHTTKTIIDTLNGLKNDRALWNQRQDGLAVFANAYDTVVYILQNQPKEIAMVGQRFHTKPLIRDQQGLDDYHVLALDRYTYTLYEGNRTGFREILLKESDPKTIQDFLGDEYTEGYLSQGSYGGVGKTPMFHGHKSRKDEVDKDNERYLKLLDRHIAENYSNKSKKPLILLALPEYHEPFRKISKNPQLINEGIKRSPRDLDEHDIKDLAWSVIEPRYQREIEALKDRFNKAYQKGIGSHNIHAIAKAAAAGRIDTILIEAHRQIPGRVDSAHGTLIHKEKHNTKIDDALDDILDLVIQNGGRATVIPGETMPTTTGAAAIYRF